MSGDSKSWEVRPHNNLVFFKPKSKKPNTNMTIITNKRIYNLELKLSNTSNFYKIKFTYPNKKLSRSEKRRQKNANLINPIKQNNTYKNWGYYYSGSELIKPIEVFDNGFYTFFRFSKNQEIPAIFRIGVFGETIANKKIKGNYIIIPGISNNGWTLRLGKLVICIKKIKTPNLKSKTIIY